MDSGWYCVVDGKDLGLLDEIQLLSVAKAAARDADFMVRREKKNWVRVSPAKLIAHLEGGARQKKVPEQNVIVRRSFPPPVPASNSLPDRGVFLDVPLILGIASIAVAGISVMLWFPLFTAILSAIGMTPTLYMLHKKPWLISRARSMPQSEVWKTWGPVLVLNSILLMCLCGSAVNLVQQQSTASKVRQMSFLLSEFDAALTEGNVDIASQILASIERAPEFKDRTQIESLRGKITDTESKRTVQRANERVAAYELEGRKAIESGELPRAEIAVHDAFKQLHATNFEPAKRLAGLVLFAKLENVNKLIESDDLRKAQATIDEAERLPSVDASITRDYKRRLANKMLAANLQQANSFFEMKRFDDAEKVLTEALDSKFADKSPDAELLLKKVRFLKNKESIDAKNTAAFGSQKGKIRIGDLSKENRRFDFATYSQSCLATVDRIINDRGQEIAVPRNKSVEVELRYNPMVLAFEGFHDRLSRFLVPSDKDRSERHIHSHIDSTKAIAHFVPGEFGAKVGDVVRLELILESGTGKTISQVWNFTLLDSD